MDNNLTIFERKDKQDYLVYTKVKPENKNVVKNLITDFDLGYRLSRKLVTNKNMIKEIIEMYFIERESFLNRMIENLQG